MNTHNGILNFGKREEEAMRCVLKHVKEDINYGGGGTFSDRTPDDDIDMKEIEKAKRGVRLIEWIIDTYKKGGGIN
jgi:hypothetical protein